MITSSLAIWQGRFHSIIGKGDLIQEYRVLFISNTSLRSYFLISPTIDQRVDTQRNKTLWKPRSKYQLIPYCYDAWMFS
jgi:hypothetical protein